jgi:hypothetical protein
VYIFISRSDETSIGQSVLAVKDNLRYQEEKMSLRQHEDDLANFFTGLGLPRRASKDLANTVCEFDEVCEALKELAEDATHKRRKRKDDDAQAAAQD